MKTTANIKTRGTENGSIEISIEQIANWIESNSTGMKIARKCTLEFVQKNVEQIEALITMRNHSGTNLGLECDFSKLFEIAAKQGFDL